MKKIILSLSILTLVVPQFSGAFSDGTCSMGGDSWNNVGTPVDCSVTTQAQDWGYTENLNCNLVLTNFRCKNDFILSKTVPLIYDLGGVDNFYSLSFQSRANNYTLMNMTGSCEGDVNVITDPFSEKDINGNYYFTEIFSICYPAYQELNLTSLASNNGQNVYDYLWGNYSSFVLNQAGWGMGYDSRLTNEVKNVLFSLKDSGQADISQKVTETVSGSGLWTALMVIIGLGLTFYVLKAIVKLFKERK